MKKDGLLFLSIKLEDVIDWWTAEQYYEQVVRQAETKEERQKLAEQLNEWCRENNIPSTPKGYL